MCRYYHVRKVHVVLVHADDGFWTFTTVERRATWGFRISVSRGYQEVLGPTETPTPIESSWSRELLCCAVNPSNACVQRRQALKFGLAGAMLNVHDSKSLVFKTLMNYYRQ